MGKGGIFSHQKISSDRTQTVVSGVRRFLYCIHECILMYNYCTGTVSMSLVYFPKADLRMWRARATLRNDQPAVTDFLEEAILQGNIHWIIARTGKPISIFFSAPLLYTRNASSRTTSVWQAARHPQAVLHLWNGDSQLPQNCGTEKSHVTQTHVETTRIHVEGGPLQDKVTKSI